MAPVGFSGARVKQIHEKKPKSIISCQTPFKKPLSPYVDFGKEIPYWPFDGGGQN